MTYTDEEKLDYAFKTTISLERQVRNLQVRVKSLKDVLNENCKVDERMRREFEGVVDTSDYPGAL